ncbi:major facilitator superfamily domain-containing protein [Ilyonectria sp. MPI-CAGE-AT-0026]|nr:major facilitator superfamily domain-containing protein [Ilyonectria sp. MPI-CAGE-AT-0026]
MKNVDEKGRPVIIEDAEEFLRMHQHEWGDYTEQDAKRVLRRIDWRLMPLLMVTLTFAGVDKIIVSNAAVYGMTDDLNLRGQQYSWAVSIFYFGYMLAAYPANAILQKYPVGRCLTLACIAWGGSVALIAASPNFAVLMFLRFVMGTTESFVFPCMTILVSMWYTKKEQPLRSALTFTSFSTLFSGTISYGIGNADIAIAPWRLLFITLGAMTMLWGVVLYFTIPDSPLQENFMKGKDKYIALDRVKTNMTGIENREFKLYQVKEAFTDYKTYILFLFYLCMNVPTGGLSAFAAQIISGIGNSKLETMLLTMPASPFQTLASLTVAIPQKWLKNKRCLSSAICCLIPLTCSILIKELPAENKTGRLLCYYFFYFFWGPYATVLSLPMANVSGHTKKLTVTASIFIAYCCAMIIGPQVFLTKEAPNYPTGYKCLMGFEIAAICLLGMYAVGCKIENKRRDKREGEYVELSLGEMVDDKTDYEKRGFRYVY